MWQKCENVVEGGGGLPDEPRKKRKAHTASAFSAKL